MVLQSHIMHKIDKTNKSAQSPWRGKHPTEKKLKFTSFPVFYFQIKYSIIIQYLSIFSLDSKIKRLWKMSAFLILSLMERGMNTTLLPYKQMTDSG